MKRIEYWNIIGCIRTQKKVHNQTYCRYSKQESKYKADILLDIERTYPYLDFFKYGHEGYNQLLNVLKAISCIFPKIGYCQGMNFFSAVVLMMLGNEEVLNSIK